MNQRQKGQSTWQISEDSVTGNFSFLISSNVGLTLGRLLNLPIPVHFLLTIDEYQSHLTFCEGKLHLAGLNTL